MSELTQEEVRELTQEEVREKFLAHVWDTIRYWESLEGKTEREKLEEVAFSLLVLLDRGSGEMPGFLVAPRPHETDKDFHAKHGEPWFPENHEIEEQVNCNIAGSLHELFSDVGQKYGYLTERK